jgi:CHAT domain-containing protein
MRAHCSSVSILSMAETSPQASPPVCDKHRPPTTFRDKFYGRRIYAHPYYWAGFILVGRG